jgi:oxygen-independent coproporphyrinogen-3 oxidase
MTLIFCNHGFRYELERLFRNFFPPIKIALSENKADITAGEDYCLTELSEEEGVIRLSVTLCVGEEHFSEQTADTEPKEQERAFSVLLYNVLSRYTGIKPPWGILTGIRPVKLLAQTDDEFAREKLLVSGEKLALSRRISEVQKPIIEHLPEKSFSLYVSIPFCPSRCSYCSFVSHSTDKSASLIEDYLDRLCEELRMTADIARQTGLSLDTIYFGGGTPTTLTAEQLERVFAALDSFDRSRLREFTVEAGRPDTITREKLLAIKNAGAGRISVNPQTMHDSVLAAIGRHHTVSQTEQAYALAREVGFDSINMDLIAGLPTDDFDGFKGSLLRVCELAPENITVHCLSLKRAAALFRQADRGISGAAEMIDFAHETLAEKGYLPYYLYRQKNTADNRENTGYAKPGTESLYNLYIMEELQTILAVGAGASTKLVDNKGEIGGRIKRIANFKYPYEYLSRFNEVEIQKRIIFEFFA